LYEQIFKAISQVADGIHQRHAADQESQQAKASIYDQILNQYQQFTAKALDFTDRPYSAALSNKEIQLQNRSGLYDALQKDLQNVIQGQQSYMEMTLKNASQLANIRTEMAIKKIDIAQKTLVHELAIHTEHTELMKYALMARNGLLIDLTAFVEKREDLYPSLSEMSKIATQLGEYGAN